jgi:O-antigen/teichoic acid export membrane protein
MVGTFALGLAVSAPVVMFANLQLRGVQATDSRRDFATGDYLGLRLLTTGVAFGLIAVIACLAGYQGETVLVILVVAAGKCFEACSDVTYGFFQQQERLDLVSFSLMIRGPLSLTAFFLFLWFKGSLVVATLAISIMWLLVLFVWDLPWGLRISKRFYNDKSAPGESFRPRWRWKILIRLALLTLPLGLVELLASLTINSPRYFIEWQGGAEALGIFSAMAYVMVAGGTIVHALGQAASPRLATYFAQDSFRSFEKMGRQLLLAGGVTGLVGIGMAIFAGPPILTLLYRAEYAQHQNVFILLMVAAAANYMATLLWFMLMATRQFKIQIALFGSSFLITIFLCAFFVPKMGMAGAALSFALAEGFRAVASYLVLNRIIRFRHAG